MMKMRIFFPVFIRKSCIVLNEVTQRIKDGSWENVIEYERKEYEKRPFVCSLPMLRCLKLKVAWDSHKVRDEAPFFWAADRLPLPI